MCERHEVESMRERQLIADGGIKNCFQQASETVWKEVGKATEKAVLLLVRAAEKAAGERGVPWKSRFPNI